ncbi:hypothetical protein LEL_04848 [Akanthomyces lecanii RCEF 1005]|uniref:Centrosomin N-terminal motif 1 domain-containing protein n=1 Tax=Akanthomyces lecanii RCEF 1005 TaxID=1081108 RepID=A0A168HNQ3_CORDF|nr:hypothetical protein LEL_04848 [Akanthomyces lecanii RCEF 1005]
MDSSTSQSGQRPRPPYPRAPSRASTIGSNTRSVSSSNTSHMQPASPAQSFAQPQRFYTTTTAASPRSSSRATPQLSREASGELARPPTMSTFLQEKLQKERRAESEKLGSSTSSRHNLDMSASVDLGRVATDRSFRSSDHEPQRPQSSAGMESAKKKGLGVKEMEQVVSSLHKQNFDLKLELYHRRERQTKLEERLGALEVEKHDAQKLSDKLQADLGKRDKAIEEAVSMIVELEAKVDQLLNERTMVQHVESQGFYASTDGFEDYDDSIANSSTADLTQLQDRSKTPTVNRMPSFLSEHNATTENLRNVYIGNRASILSLRRISGGHSEADNAMMNGLASPTLSVLSESSFMSVYGQKGGDTTVIDFDDPIALSGFDGSSPVIVQESPASGARNQKHQQYYDNDHLLSSKHQQEYRPATVRPINDVLSQDSPLQRLEKGDSGPRTGGPDVPLHQADRSEASQNQHRNSVHGSPARRSIKDEKRAALRKVVTDAGGVRLYDQAMPPTPDTISSSTLQRYKNSNDNLSVRHQVSDERQRISSNETRQTREPHAAEQSGGGVSLLQKEPSRNARSSRQPDAGAMPSYDPYGSKNIPRPHSAGDTTVSHKRNNSWDSDDESDTKSLQSSLDIWMRESTKLPKTTAGRVSPDLFGFPTSMARGGWAASSLFDPKQRLGSMTSTDYMHDLLSLREALLSPNLPPPPPPDRRSSLYGVGRSMSAMPTTEKPLAAEGTWQAPPPSSGAASATARNRRNSDAADLRSSTRTPVQGDHKRGNSSSTSANHQHPPISWQQGPRTGLKGLFRRSLPGGGIPPSATVSSPAKSDCISCAQDADAPASSWASRSSAATHDCDRTGATPPPIMLNNPRQAARRSSIATVSYDGASSSAAAPAAVDAQSVKSQAADAMSQHSIPNSQSTTGTRRKWLPGFSRNKA